MSTRSDPSASTTSGGRPTRDTCHVALDRYLSDSPTITEKLAFPEAAMTGVNDVAQREKKTEATLYNWQLSWEQKQNGN